MALFEISQILEGEDSRTIRGTVPLASFANTNSHLVDTTANTIVLVLKRSEEGVNELQYGDTLEVTVHPKAPAAAPAVEDTPPPAKAAPKAADPVPEAEVAK